MIQRTNLQESKQSGLSLVEMMISMAISALVIVGVVNLFAANSETYKLMQGQSRMQESARFGLDYLSRAIQHAGYNGCFSTDEDIHFTVDGAATIPYEFDIQRGIQGIDGWSGAASDLDTNYYSGTANDTGIDTTAIAAGTDVLTVRSISSSASLFVDLLDSTDDVVVTVPPADLKFSAAGGGKPKHDLALIHDCEKATIFVVTEVTGTTQATIGHGIADLTTNSIATLARDNTFEDDAFVSAIVTSTFFIAPGLGINNEGDSPLSLWRKTGTDAPVELIEGVEDMQLLYGFDEDGNGTPEIYNKASNLSGTQYFKVKTVRISITVNSVDSVGASTADGLIRRTFHQTVQLRNKG
jgi:type IV pilus assembly protein PilW